MRLIFYVSWKVTLKRSFPIQNHFWAIKGSRDIKISIWFFNPNLPFRSILIELMYLIPLKLKVDAICFKLATGMKIDPNNNYLVLWETFARDDNISSSHFFTHSLTQSQTVLLWGIWFRTHLGNISGVSRAYSGIFRNNTGISQACIRHISGIYQAFLRYN